MGQLGSWVGSLFIHEPPQLALRPSEQRLLLAAIAGGTDQELADQLVLSLSAVKKTWRAIYGRVAERRPDLAPEDPRDGKSFRERGRAKKQRLIAYLREHPEELRPVASRTSLRRAAR